jgi:hypothetical protein
MTLTGMIFRRTKLTLGLLIVVAFSCISVSAQRSFDDLERHLNKEMVGPEATQVIKRHLTESATNAPLDNLVAWAKAGFPDLQDENGYWKTESISLKLGVVQSIRYYFSTSPPDDKSNRYLAILDELRKDDYISFHLQGMAFLFVDESLLEHKVEQLLQENDPKLRAEGVHLGRTIAEHKPSLFERYQQMLKTDEDPHVRTTILYSILGWRRRDVAFIAFDRLVNDSNSDVRDWGARGLRTAADRGILSVDDLPTLLPAMLKTNEPFVRINIGHVAARLSTPDRSLFVRTDKFTDELLYGFISSVRMKGTRARSALSEAELAKEWVDWWTPLIPEYTQRPTIVR